MDERIDQLQSEVRRLQEQLDDLRQDSTFRPVRLAPPGGSIPPGQGRFKSLQLMDDLNPGTPGWDYRRFFTH